MAAMKSSENALFDSPVFVCKIAIMYGKCSTVFIL